MNKSMYSILDGISEGIVILNEKFEIIFWNMYMEQITEIDKEKVIYNDIFKVLPKFNTNYFKKSINDALINGNNIFLSAAMHPGLVSDKYYLNLKISQFEEDEFKFLILEFINITNQFIQINKLKGYINELYSVNKQLKEKEKIIKNLAYYDSMTGLANRTLFYSLSERFLNNAKRDNSLLGLMFIDIDRFKSINDTYGHQAGDRVIVRVAEILKEATRKNDIVARHGGDEFLILFPYIKSIDNCEIIISRIINNQNRIINIQGNEIRLSFSMGFSFYPDDGDDIDKLIAKADKAMYVAKNKECADCSAYHF